MIFEDERQANIPCVNTLCDYDSTSIQEGVGCGGEDSSGDPLYAKCKTYLPEKLLEEAQNTTDNIQSAPFPCCIEYAKKCADETYRAHRLMDFDP